MIRIACRVQSSRAGVLGERGRFCGWTKRKSPNDNQKRCVVFATASRAVMPISLRPKLRRAPRLPTQTPEPGWERLRERGEHPDALAEAKVAHHVFERAMQSATIKLGAAEKNRA
jgi:hypothetical protein